MRIITKERAQEILTPYVGKIRSCVKGSVERYFSGHEFASVRHILSKRSDASNCHDLIVDAIMRDFENVPRTKCFYTNKLFLLTIEDYVVLRFKMFDQGLLSHGIHTQQLISFNHQEMQQLEFEVPDMPPNGLLYVGYCLNQLRTGVEGVYITCRFGNHNVWEWDITEEQTAIIKHIEFQDSKPTPARRRKPTLKTNNVGDINVEVRQ